MSQYLLSKAPSLYNIDFQYITFFGANYLKTDSIVAVQGMYRDRLNARMTAETDHRLWDDWLHWMHSDNPSSRIIAFDYDSSHIEAGINTIGCFKNRALQLLDGLVKLRGKTDLVAVCILSILYPIVESGNELMYLFIAYASSNSVHRSWSGWDHCQDGIVLANHRSAFNRQKSGQSSDNLRRHYGSQC